MTDKEIDELVAMATEAIEVAWLERGSAKEREGVKIDMKLMVLFGAYAKQQRTELAEANACLRDLLAGGNEGWLALARARAAAHLAQQEEGAP